MEKIGLDSPRGYVSNNLKNALKILDLIKFPIIVRPSFTLGGAGGGTARNKEEFIKIIKKGISLSPINEVLIEESLSRLERI